MDRVQATLDRIATQLQHLIAQRNEAWLARADVRVPAGLSDRSTDAWARSIEERLADCGVDRVDVRVEVAEVSEAEITRTVFDDHWAE